jgi:hypothetical protein
MATQEELAIQQQAASTNEMMNKIAPNVVNKASDMAMQSREQEFNEQQV